MNETNHIGTLGETYVLIGLQQVYSLVKKTGNDIEQQLTYGDFASRGDSRLAIPPRTFEVKTEKSDKYGNFFFEKWSNLKLGRMGWFDTCKTDELFYLFWESGFGYRFPDWKNSKWMLDYRIREKGIVLNKQKQYTQENDTWGYPTPFDIIEAGPFMPFRFTLCETRKKDVERIVLKGAA